MAYAFKLIGVLGIILSVVFGALFAPAGGPLNAAVAVTYSVGGFLGSLVLLAIGGALERLDDIVRNTAEMANHPSRGAVEDHGAPAFQWKAKD